jgi:murein DD-endopeptidase MepM/ murein hydrolase activator NlpD
MMSDQILVIRGELLTPDHPDWPFRPPVELPAADLVVEPLLGGCWWSGNAFDPSKPISEGGHFGRDGFNGPKGVHGWKNSANAQVIAALAGICEKAKWYENGLWVRINHGDGLKTVAGHMNGRGLVAKGQEVVAGTQIGPLWAKIEPPHLHWEAWLNGHAVEPVELLEKLGPVRMAA